jgi:hypothetical protein
MCNALRGEKSVTVAGGATQTAAIGTGAGATSDINSATSGQLSGNAIENGKRLKSVQGMMKAFTGLSRRGGQASSMHAKSSPSLFSIGAGSVAADSTITVDGNASNAPSNQRQSESANNTANIDQSSCTVSFE